MNVTSQPQNMDIAIVVGIVTIWIMPWLPVHALAQHDSAAPDNLVVGVSEKPPFIMKTADGGWEGLSIELWQAVAQALGVTFELRAYRSIGPILDAFAKGELDVFILAAVTEQRETTFDFSQSYHRSGSAIAVPVKTNRYGWLRFAEYLFSLAFLIVVGILLLLWLIAGTLVWLCEGHRNRDMFGDGPVQGIGQGIWWAAVTMTTVGYGDKAPKTLGGRFVAIIWMFVSIMLISGFTATLTTTLTVTELSGKVRGLRDLPSVRVGSVAQSEALNFLVQRGITVRPFGDERQGLQAIVDDKIDAFVFDESILTYLARTKFPGRVQVIAETFNHYYVSMAMPPGSPLRESLNRALLKVMATDNWLRLRQRHLGLGPGH